SRENLFTIRTLRNFRYVDDRGKDQGAGIRELSRKIADLLKNDREIRNLRKNARKQRSKYTGISAADARYRVRRGRYDDSGSSSSRDRYRERDERRPSYDDSSDDGDSSYGGRYRESRRRDSTDGWRQSDSGDRSD